MSGPLKIFSGSWARRPSHASCAKSEAQNLTANERANLARELIESLEPESNAEIDELWISEAIQRDQEIDEGTAQTYPADEVLARARKLPG